MIEKEMPLLSSIKGLTQNARVNVSGNTLEIFIPEDDLRDILVKNSPDEIKNATTVRCENGGVKILIQIV